MVTMRPVRSILSTFRFSAFSVAARQRLRPSSSRTLYRGTALG
jgi:hypothetical protein